MTDQELKDLVASLALAQSKTDEQQAKIMASIAELLLAQRDDRGQTTVFPLSSENPGLSPITCS